MNTLTYKLYKYTWSLSPSILAFCRFIYTFKTMQIDTHSHTQFNDVKQGCVSFITSIRLPEPGRQLNYAGNVRGGLEDHPWRASVPQRTH